MNQNQAGGRPLNDSDVDLLFDELRRLTRVDALLRVVAAHDRSDAIAPSDRQAARARIDFRCIRRHRKW